MDNSVTAGYDGMNLPFSPEAEQSVLGAILLDSSCMDRVAEILPRHDYFYLTGNFRCLPMGAQSILLQSLKH